MSKRNKISTQKQINLKQEEIRKAKEELENLTNIKKEEDKVLLYDTMINLGYTVEYVVKTLTQIHEKQAS